MHGCPTLAESAGDETLIVPLLQNPAVTRASSVSISWPGERLDVLALELLSRDMGVASWSRTTFPHLPEFHSSTMLLCPWVLTPHNHPRAYSMLMAFLGHWRTCLLVCLDEQFLSLRVKPSWMTWVCTLAGTGHEFTCLQVADAEIVSWREPAPLTHTNCFSGRVRISAVQGLQPVPVEISLRPTAGDPESTKDQSDGDGQDLRVFAPLYSSANRRVRKLVRISKQSRLTLQVVWTSGRMILTSVRLGNTCGGLTGPWRGSSWLGLRELDILRSSSR